QAAGLRHVGAVQLQRHRACAIGPARRETDSPGPDAKLSRSYGFVRRQGGAGPSAMAAAPSFGATIGVERPDAKVFRARQKGFYENEPIKDRRSIGVAVRR